MKSTTVSQFAINQRLHWAFALLAGVFAYLVWFSSVQAIAVTPPRLELSGDPGSTIRSEIKVTNDSDSTVTYYTQVENFEAQDESGQPNFVPAKEGLATWVGVDQSVTLKAGEQKTIPFTISVPKNAEPGGYFASVFVRTTPPPRSGGEVSIGARLGTLLLVRVNGDIQEGVNILEFGTKDSKRFFTALPVDLYYRFQNTGADRVKPEGDIVIKNLLGMTSAVVKANRTEGSVLPRSIRRFESSWTKQEEATANTEEAKKQAPDTGFFGQALYQVKNFAFGIYTANLDIRFGENNNTAQAKYRFVVFPWQLITIVLVGLLLIIFVLRFVLKRYNNHIINQHRRNS